MARDENFVAIYPRAASVCGLAFSFLSRLRNPQFVRKKDPRLAVQKTYKLFIGGKFVRGENGRVLPRAGCKRQDSGELLPRFAQRFSRCGDGGAQRAVGGWSKQSAYLRGQILYRAAEMLEMRQGELRSGD